MVVLGQASRETSQANPGGHYPETQRRVALDEASDPMLPRKSSSERSEVPVPQTDAGGQVENTEAIERTLVKELGKLPP